jgi:hypothetical protein
MQGAGGWRKGEDVGSRKALVAAFWGVRPR